MTHLLLDAAFPPNPQQWIADMNAVGADGGFVYVYGPLTNYTAAHVSTARDDGKIVLPIIVPGNAWPASFTLISALRSYGFADGPVIVDLETNSLPPDQGLVSFAAYASASGFQVDRYGNQSMLGKYTPEGEDWIADWIRTGQLNPLPTLPQGWHSWQFVNDVVINGSQYDASIVDDEFVGGIGSMAEVTLDPRDGFVQEIRERVNDIESILANGVRQSASFDANGVPTYASQPDWPDWLVATLGAINRPTVDASAVASALAGNTAFVQAIAVAVAHELGSALDKAQ